VHVSFGGAKSTRTGESCWALPSISSFGVMVATEYISIVLDVGLDPPPHERSPLDNGLVNFVASPQSVTPAVAKLFMLYLLQRNLPAVDSGQLAISSLLTRIVTIMVCGPYYVAVACSNKAVWDF